MNSTIKIVIAVVLAGAGVAGVGYLSCGCSPQTQATIVRQGPPAIACLPVYLPQIVKAAEAHDVAAVLTHAAELYACWVQHEAPAPAPGNATGSAS